MRARQSRTTASQVISPALVARTSSVAVSLLRSAALVWTLACATLLMRISRLHGRKLGLLPPPFTGEGWGGGRLTRIFVSAPLPNPPPQAGEGIHPVRGTLLP